MEQNFKDFLKEQFENKGLTIEKVGQQTGISDRHLHALLEGDIKKLPSAPYVRGYLAKIATLLDLNINSLWKIYTREFPLPTSGASDYLPSNRYAIKPLNRRWLTIGGIAILLLIYLGTNAERLIGQPTLDLASPASETTATVLDTIVVSGKINPNDKLLIDNQEVVTDENGLFTKPYPLEPGLNQVEFVVKRFLGRELRITRRIIYQP